MTEPFQSLGQQLSALARQAKQAANGEVDAILLSGECDASRIENLLDHMLGFCYDPDMLLNYKRLCYHYFTINP